MCHILAPVSACHCRLVEQQQQTAEQKPVIRENYCHQRLLATRFGEAEEFL